MLTLAGANVYNDVGDDISGADPGNTEHIYPYTGGSRFIQTGLLSRAQMSRLAFGLGAAALLLGALLAVLRGPGVIWLGCAGLGLGILYSMPGVQLAARGLGEATVAIGFGALPVLGSVWLQTGFVDLARRCLCAGERVGGGDPGHQRSPGYGGGPSRRQAHLGSALGRAAPAGSTVDWSRLPWPPLLRPF